ncbi:hypothetical protein CXF74_11740 [Psychromonas sp. Urea-02u-13]|nr:hypothetical protein CXF74_11740 [Psychromonas sp. Urea-02u-13]
MLIGFILMLSACSSIFPWGDSEQFTIIEQGKNIDNRPNMEEVCKGFYISPSIFDAFFEYASITHEETLNERYKSLPCYSSGITYIEEEKFNWIIRAGGVGEFYNETQSFTKVCGIACCAKVDGVC